MRVKFIGNPVGLYNLSYDPGDVIDLPDQLANDLIADKLAIEEVQTAESKKEPEKAVLNRGKKK